MKTYNRVRLQWGAFVVFLSSLAVTLSAEPKFIATNDPPFTTIGTEHFDQKMLFTTVRIEATRTNPPGMSIGTAFICNYDLATNNFAVFLVTNRHVVNGYDHASFSFIKKKNDKPFLDEHETVKLDDLSHWWFGHPNTNVDIAIIPLTPLLSQNGVNPYSLYLGGINANTLNISKSDLDHLRANEQVIFIGYPANVFDKKHFLPLARRGYTASSIAVDFDGEKLFLIDAAVFPGSSRLYA